MQRLIDGPGYVVIPLSRTASDISGDTIDAFLVVGSSRGARFARDDLRLLQELGALLALALRNLELYEAMQRANGALQESNEFKDDLLAMLAHDFKGPLTVILGYCELLMETGSPAPRSRRSSRRRTGSYVSRKTLSCSRRRSPRAFRSLAHESTCAPFLPNA